MSDLEKVQPADRPKREEAAKTNRRRMLERELTPEQFTQWTKAGEK
jgi:hypothetical protein